MDFDLMLGLRKHIQVASHRPGRLKLRFGLKIIGNAKVIEYVKENGFAPPKGQDMPGVTKTRFNPLTRSMTMMYDAGVIEPELLHKLFTSNSDEEFETRAHELAQTVDFDLAVFH
ncbi:MAG: hypothetical protein D6E12_17240 [Desulfovibrio sp.]|nr:MAG: hypothetical protein D6E12_17240 [Desulfovibrio sp.]